MEMIVSEIWGNITLPGLTEQDMMRDDLNRLVSNRRNMKDPEIQRRRLLAATSAQANHKRSKTMQGYNQGDSNVSRRPEVRLKNQQNARQRFADPLNVPRMQYETIATHIETGEQLRFLGNKQLKAAGFDASNVHHCITGRYKQYKGYRWHREEIK